MPARLYPATPTRLLTWLDCPRRYRFAYLDRPMPPKGPPWAHNSVGAAVHSALAWIAMGAIALHAAAGLFHHFVYKDDTLARVVLGLRAMRDRGK